METIQGPLITETSWGLLVTAFFILIGVVYDYNFVLSHCKWRFQVVKSGLIVVAISFVSIGVFIGMGRWALDSVLLSLAVGAGIVVSLIHPVIAVSFALSNYIIRPWEYLDTAIILTLLPKTLAALCFFSWLIYSYRIKKFQIYFNKTCLIFFLFLVWAFLASVWGQNIPYFFERFIPVVVLFFLIFNSVHSKEELSLVEGSMIIAILGMIVAADYFTLSTPELDRLTGGTLLGNANDLVSFIILALPFLFCPAFKRSFLGYIPFVIALLAFTIGIFLADSRAAKLALALMAFAYGMTTFKITFFRLLIGAVISFVLLLGVFVTTRSKSDLTMSTGSRMNYAVTGVRMLIHNPIFGVGLGNYPKRYEEFSTNFDEYGERTAHSSWVLIMSEAGIFGLMLYSALFLSILYKAWKLRKIRPAFYLSMLGYGLTMSFLSHTYMFFPYVLFALVLVGYRVYFIQAVDKQIGHENKGIIV